ncbi:MULTISPECIES: hypothetical protein [Ruminococcus]|uniref:Lipocalin-like domain-containing protein n=1 Tax=Ruminococcus flavefaciens TaxID=1265 RepID=A0A1M7IZN6_RUMFL|nr:MULTISPECIES: hypothetical protein [Ruminococcus]MCR4793750.1 hypothetical protein [Ruminococcus sp.]SHM46304.1 hypothetical protein SAMN04487860_10548 [Ruminococcus flavefaciens]
MKRIISSIAVCSLAVCAFASCGNSSSSSKDISGKWSIDDLDNNSGIKNGGIIFKDGKGSVYADSSSILHFEDDGFNVSGTTLSKEYFKEDGKKLTIDVSGQEMIVMTKLDDKDGYDGKYSLDGGLLYDGIKQGITKGSDEVPDSINITLEFDGDHSEFVFNDLFDYKTKGDKITITGYSAIMDLSSDGGTAKYKIDGDKLTIKGSKKSETFTKVK